MSTEMVKASILLVDDEYIIRKTLSKELKDEQFSVTDVASGVDAIRALQDFQFNLVITDLMMEGVDGFGVLRAVKEIAPLTRVIVITGYGDVRTAIDALHLGADDFLVKPFEIDEFVFRIRRCLEKRSLLEMLMEKTNQLEKENERSRCIEKKLFESDTRYRLALDVSSNGVWDRNVISGETFYGENWYRTLGYVKEEEKSFGEELLHPDDRERVLAVAEEHLQGKTPRFEAEFRLLNSVGKWQWVLSRGKVVERDKQGRALRVIGTITDITRLKKEADELRQVENDLKKKLQDCTEQLEKAETALQMARKNKAEPTRDVVDRDLSGVVPILVESLLNQLEDCSSAEQQKVLLNDLRANINRLISPAGTNFDTSGS